MGNSVKQTVIGFGVAVTILAVFLWQVGFTEVVNTAASIQPIYLAAGIFFSLLSPILFGTAWWTVLKDVINVSYLHGLYLFFAAQFANQMTPFGQIGGEPAVAYIVSQDADIDMSKCLGAILVGDIMNAIVSFSVFFLGAITFLLFFSFNTFFAAFLLGAILLAILVGAVFFTVWRKKNLVVRFVDRVGLKLLHVLDWFNIREKLSEEEEKEALQEKTELFHATLRNRFADRRILLQAVFFLFLNMVAAITGIYLFLLGMGVSHVSYAALFFIYPAAWLANYAPLPGGLGGVEVALSLLLLMFAAVPMHAASAATLLFRLSTFWVIILVGGIFASQLSLNMFNKQT